MEWCLSVPRLFVTLWLHLCHTRQSHVKTPVSNSEKYSVYIVANVALEHSPGTSRNKTNTLTYFSARDFSFSLLDTEKTISGLESTKGKEVLNQIL